jgi:hypothetical protein
MYRFCFWRVTIPAVLIFVPLTVLDVLAEHAADDHTADTSALGELVYALSLASTSGLLFGWVVYAGLLDSLVGAQHFGHREVPVHTALRDLPYRRLIVANVIITVLVVVGTLFLAVPGLIAWTLFGVVGPVIVIEGRGALSALGRSARLVLRHAWLAIVLITLPIVGEQTLEDLVVTVRETSLWLELLAAVGLTLVVGVAVSLVEVVLAHELIARDRTLVPPPFSAAAAVPRAP